MSVQGDATACPSPQISSLKVTTIMTTPIGRSSRVVGNCRKMVVVVHRGCRRILIGNCKNAGGAETSLITPNFLRRSNRGQRGTKRYHIYVECVCARVCSRMCARVCATLYASKCSPFSRGASRCESVHRACLEMPCPPCSVATSSMPCKSMMPPPKLHNIQVAFFNNGSQDFASSVLTTCENKCVLYLLIHIGKAIASSEKKLI